MSFTMCILATLPPSKLTPKDGVGWIGVYSEFWKGSRNIRLFVCKLLYTPRFRYDKQLNEYNSCQLSFSFLGVRTALMSTSSSLINQYFRLSNMKAKAWKVALTIYWGGVSVVHDIHLKRHHYQNDLQEEAFLQIFRIRNNNLNSKALTWRSHDNSHKYSQIHENNACSCV